MSKGKTLAPPLSLSGNNIEPISRAPLVTIFDDGNTMFAKNVPMQLLINAVYSTLTVFIKMMAVTEHIQKSSIIRPEFNRKFKPN